MEQEIDLDKIAEFMNSEPEKEIDEVDKKEVFELDNLKEVLEKLNKEHLDDTEAIANLITSRLCSIIITVLPLSTSFSITFINIRMSSKCNPVVGSSNIYRVFPVSRLANSVASLTRWH